MVVADWFKSFKKTNKEDKLLKAISSTETTIEILKRIENSFTDVTKSESLISNWLQDFDISDYPLEKDNSPIFLSEYEYDYLEDYMDINNCLYSTKYTKDVIWLADLSTVTSYIVKVERKRIKLNRLLNPSGYYKFYKKGLIDLRSRIRNLTKYINVNSSLDEEENSFFNVENVFIKVKHILLRNEFINKNSLQNGHRIENTFNYTN